MANLRSLGKVVKPCLSFVSYTLANAGTALIADSGINAINTPEVIDNTLLYSSLGLFNLGVLYPIANEGIGNFCRRLFGRNPNTKINRSKLRAGALAGLSALVVASTRETFFDDVPNSEVQIVEPISEVQVVEPISEVQVVEPILPPVNSNPEGDIGLENRIQTYVNGLREKGLARERGIENFAIYMKDLKSNEVFVEINADRQQMGASTLKLAVMVAGFEKIHENKLKYSDEIKEDMIKMICKSNNNATNRMIQRIGLDYINNFVRKKGLEQTEVDIIPKDGRTLTNKTSARDLGDLLENIYNGRLNGSNEMKEILAKDCQKHRDRIVDGTCIPIKRKSLEEKGAFVDEVYGKTGFIYGVNANAGIIEARFLGEDDNHPYIAVVLIEDQKAKSDRFLGNDKAWGRSKSKVIRWISEECFLYEFNKYSSVPNFKCDYGNGEHPQ